MFKNCVFKLSVNTKEWIKASAIRAIKTMAQTAVGLIGTSVMISDVSWQVVVSASLLSGLVSILTSIAGIPEVPSEEKESNE